MKNLLAGLLAAMLAACMPTHAQEWGEEAYELLKMTFAYDAGYPLGARQVGLLERDGTRWEKIVFESFHDGLVPGLLAVPSEGEGPYPVMLLLHGLNGNKSQWLADAFTHGGEVAKGFLNAGYAVLALDAQYHGERAVYNHFINPAEMVFGRGWGMRYVNLLAQSVVDYRRAIDYLATRDDIDVARVGIMGYSMGGHMTFILGAVEPRVKAVVACVVPATPGMPVAAMQFAREMGGQPLLLMMARQDDFYTVEEAQALFDRVPGDRKQMEFFDSGHSLPEAYAGMAVTWVKSVL